MYHNEKQIKKDEIEPQQAHSQDFERGSAAGGPLERRTRELIGVPLFRPTENGYPQSHITRKSLDLRDLIS